MDDAVVLVFMLMVIVVIGCVIALPIVALVISIRTRNRLAARISRLEATLSPPGVGQFQKPAPGIVPPVKAPPPVPERPESQPPGPATQPPPVTPVPQPLSPVRPIDAERIESIIGRRWLGWAAVGVILFAAAFFLKYAFDNRWIGELGRVAIGVAAGIGMTVLGFRYHKRHWRVFSQILTGGGVVLLYLSAYAAFGYYHLATQKAAFAYLAILVAEAAGLAYLYNAPAIAIMALLGGFLAPVLLHSDRDQYRSLFGYIAALDVGALAMFKLWVGLRSLAFFGTHLLFWLWYTDNYHPRKLGAVMIFQTAVFLIFLLAHIGRQLVRPKSVIFEDLALLLINPFVFFATAYHLLNANYHDWMGVFAIGMALLYAGAAKILLDRKAATGSESLLIIGVALTFLTIAIPIQLRQNWITIAWSVEALVMLWAGIETKAQRLRALACTLFALALARLFLWDTLRRPKLMFTLILNKYFLCSLVVTGCLFGAAVLYQRVGERKQILAPRLRLGIVLVAIVTLWFVMSVETNTFFVARAAARKLAEDWSRERWLGQMALSVLWSIYAGALAAIGFIRRSAVVRWAALALFGLTVIKAMLVDIAELQQLYRIIVFFVLGVLLLVVAWGYHKAFHSRESST